MTINRWLGIAQSRAERRIMYPMNITPGSLWQLRVGTRTYEYTYPSTIEVSGLTANDKAKTVVDGLIALYEGGGTTLGGGADTTSLTLTADLQDGKWGILAIGGSNGSPIDVALTGSDPTAATISVVQLQAGQAQRNEIQRIKWPQTPTGGNLVLRYADGSATVAYNANAAAVQSALEGISAIGSGNVTVTGAHTSEYRVEFKGTLAGQNVDLINAYSSDSTGTAAYTVEKIQSAQIVRQTYTLAKLSGNANDLFHFELSGESGHLFTGAATNDAILLALESVPTIGTGNVTVERLADGTTTITLIGKFVGFEIDGLSVVADGNADVPSLTGEAPVYSIRPTQLRFRILNLPDASISVGTSYFKFYTGGSQSGNIALGYSTTQITTACAAGTLPWSCVSISGGRETVLEIVMQYTAGNQLPVDGPMLLADVSTLIGCLSIDVRTVQTPLSNKNEIQQLSIATDPTGGTFTLSFGGYTTSTIAYNASASTIQTALAALTSIGSGNVGVSGPVGGPWIVEFKSSLAAADQALITGNGASLTFSATVGVTTTQLATPTGPNWWNNAANWSLGNVPASTDIATFENGAVPCLYGLTSVPAFAGMDVYRSYTGTIGLPSIRADGSPETLNTDLQLTDNTSTFILRIGLGDEGSGPSTIRVAAGSQDVQASVIYTSQSAGQTGYTCMLSGAINDLIIGSASVGVAIDAGDTATVGKIRIRPPAQAQTVVEWGEGAAVDSVQMTGGTLRAGKVPKSLFITGGEATVRGTGSIDALLVRNAQVRWLASGTMGKQGLISALALDGSNRALLTSNGHGLTSGDRIYLRGIVGVTGLPDNYYTVSVVDANNFALVGTAPGKPFAATSPSAVADYYQTNTASWGLANSISVGEGGSVDFSELAALRTVVAPVVMQSPSALFNDPLVTIAGLRLRYDPGALEDTLGTGCVVMRDERSAAGAVSGNPSGAGGFVIAP